MDMSLVVMKDHMKADRTGTLLADSKVAMMVVSSAGWMVDPMAGPRDESSVALWVDWTADQWVGQKAVSKVALLVVCWAAQKDILMVEQMGVLWGMHLAAWKVAL